MSHERKAATSASGITGQKGEERAVHYLTSQGCIVLDRNWQAHPGEIDIIANCPSRTGDRSTLAFIEVRTRRGRQGLAEESISPRKAASMVSAAYSYMESHSIDPEAVPWRIDLITIALDDNTSTISWIKNCISEDML